MAVTFQYDAAQELLVITFRGELRDQELIAAFLRAGQCCAERNVKLGIIDGTQVTEFAGTAEMIKSLAGFHPMFPVDSKRCMVVDQDFLFGMARMYQMLAGETREGLRVVRTLQEACEYLGVRTIANLAEIDG